MANDDPRLRAAIPLFFERIGVSVPDDALALRTFDEIKEWAHVNVVHDANVTYLAKKARGALLGTCDDVREMTARLGKRMDAKSALLVRTKDALLVGNGEDWFDKRPVGAAPYEVVEILHGHPREKPSKRSLNRRKRKRPENAEQV